MHVPLYSWLNAMEGPWKREPTRILVGRNDQLNRLTHDVPGEESLIGFEIWVAVSIDQ